MRVVNNSLLLPEWLHYELFGPRTGSIYRALTGERIGVWPSARWGHGVSNILIAAGIIGLTLVLGQIS